MNFLGLLTVLFIGLKLTDFIDWSWWFVLMPLWALPIVIIVLSVIAAFATVTKKK